MKRLQTLFGKGLKMLDFSLESTRWMVGGVLCFAAWVVVRFEKVIAGLRKADELNMQEINGIREQMQARHRENSEKFCTHDDFSKHQDFIRNQFDDVTGRLGKVTDRLDDVYRLMISSNGKSRAK